MLDFGFYNMDCMEGMKEFPDNYFDLAIVDPPYGDGGGSFKSSDGTRFGERFDRYKTVGGGGRHHTFGARKKYATYTNRRNMGSEIRKKIVAWDVAPEQEYFDELFRISRNQIIWGGELFSIATFKGVSDMAQNKCTAKLQHGNGRVRMDVIPAKRKGV